MADTRLRYLYSPARPRPFEAEAQLDGRRCARFALWGSLLLALSLLGLAPSAGSLAPTGTMPEHVVLNGPALLGVETPLGYPWGVAYSPDGHLLITDAKKHQLFHLSEDGMLSLAAGTGSPGFSGDGGSALYASFNGPSSVLAGPDGSIYVADTLNNRVRRIAPDGVVTTVAGSGQTNAAGQSGFSGDGGPATLASLNAPHGLALDAQGALYIADTNNGRIRRVDAQGIIATVAGGGKSKARGDGEPANSVQLSSPLDLVVAGPGHFFFTDRYASRVYEVTADGALHRFAGGGTRPSGEDGPATEARLGVPTALCLDPDGGIVFADTRYQALFRVKEGRLTTIARSSRPTADGAPSPSPGDDAPPPLEMATPSSVVLSPRGGYVVADWSAHQVLKVETDGSISVMAGTGEDPAVTGRRRSDLTVQNPIRGATWLPGGALVFTDPVNGRLLRLERNRSLTALPIGTRQTVVEGASIRSPEPLFGPSGAVAMPNGDLVLSEVRSHRVRRVAPSGQVSVVAGIGAPGFTGDGKPGPQSRLWDPLGLALDPSGRITVADSRNGRIRRVEADGTLSTVAGGGHPQPRPIILAGTAAPGSGTPTDNADSTAPPAPPSPAASPSPNGDGLLATQARLKQPAGISWNPGGSLAITEPGEGIVRRVRPSGVIETFAGGGGEAPVVGQPAVKGQLWEPVGVAYAPNGDLAVSDAGDHRVWILAPDGIVKAVIGAGGGGDEETAGNVVLNRPTGLAYTPGGDLYIVCADRVLRLSADGRITTEADETSAGWGGALAGSEEPKSWVEKIAAMMDRFRNTRVTRAIQWVQLPHLSFIGPTQAVVTWETDLPTSGVVEFGASARLDRQVSSGTETTHPVVPLKGLEPSTTYRFNVTVTRVARGVQDELTSRVDRFTTLAAGQPITPVSLDPADTLPAGAMEDTPGTPVASSSPVETTSDAMAQLRYALIGVNRGGAPPEAAVRAVRRALGLE